MTAIDPATCWVPVPIRWRYVQPGDVFSGGAGLFWVQGIEHGGPAVVAHVVGPNTGAKAHPYILDPDEMVSVLVPIPERDAGALTVEQLGAVVIGRRTAGEVA